MGYPNLGRCLSFTAGSLGMMISGGVFAVPVYINAIKLKFNYEQWIVELIVALFSFGIFFQMPAGILCERFGPSWTSFVGFLFAGTGYMMQLSTTFYVEFYSNKGELQAVFHFLIGLGYGCLFISSIMTNIDNFAPQHRGKAVSFMYTAFNIGTILTSWIYGAAFVNGHINDEENQDLKGFYISTTVVVLVISIMCIIFLRSFPVDSELIGLVDNDSLPNTMWEHCIEDVTGCQLFKLLDFEFLLWGSILSVCVQLVFINNVGTILKSFRMEEYSIIFVTATSISQMVSKLFTGFLTDVLIQRVPRITVILVSTLIQTVFAILCIFFSDIFTILMLTNIVLGMSDATLWCIGAVAIREYYGIKYFGRNVGMFSTITATSAIGMQVIFGWMYQLEIPNENEKNCFGEECYKLTFVLHSVMSFLSVLLFIGVYRNHCKKNEHKG